jgi:hypothetical protein
MTHTPPPSRKGHNDRRTDQPLYLFFKNMGIIVGSILAVLKLIQWMEVNLAIPMWKFGSDVAELKADIAHANQLETERWKQTLENTQDINYMKQTMELATGKRSLENAEILRQQKLILRKLTKPPPKK